jgi:mannose-6-phosphate isomerase-like protein (cupin superfamily)
MVNFKVSLEKASQLLQNHDKPFKLLFEHSSLEIELYKPLKFDLQNPHERDEVYIIASGNGKFHVENVVVDFKTGDFLFVPAGAEHRFFDFSEDFSTWVIFYGQKGGENGEIKNFTH